MCRISQDYSLSPKSRVFIPSTRHLHRGKSLWGGQCSQQCGNNDTPDPKPTMAIKFYWRILGKPFSSLGSSIATLDGPFWFVCPAKNFFVGIIRDKKFKPPVAACKVAEQCRQPPLNFVSDGDPPSRDFA
ncbi:hypothetical protein TNIN_47421 [Trichonephila inaurata madagascariensis]|uniref:Uncharacterized protein n=1 Tax=Trichonephila inaurata madagascariensis TaxID=2747483 RepID=A0A8X7CPB9_9ARAC|nr:hypothetical protein TNIN_47421 [Trichonephila inaurata madagascariensis]